jgi:hypothetical protein
VLGYASSSTHVTTGPTQYGVLTGVRAPSTTVALTIFGCINLEFCQWLELTVPAIFCQKNQGLFTSMTFFNAVLGLMEVGSSASERAGWVRLDRWPLVVSTA